MIATKERKAIKQMAKEIQKRDKRLSWETCVKKAQSQIRLFNQTH